MFKSKSKNEKLHQLRKFNFIKGNNANLDNNPQFQLARKHALVHYPSGAVYSFIPKNACTTMRTSLAVANGFLGEEDLANQINWVHNNTYTFSATVPELVKAPYTFAILRDPYERLASLFLDKFIDKTPVAWNFYRATNNQVDLDELTFTEFVGWLEKKPGLLRCDIHLRPQTDFLIYRDYDDYFWMEEFSKIQQTLADKLNFAIKDARSITNHGRGRYDSAKQTDYSNLSAWKIKQLKQNRQLPETSSLFTDRIREVVSDLYSDDFR